MIARRPLLRAAALAFFLAPPAAAPAQSPAERLRAWIAGVAR